jgi:hypothetical protein
VRRRRLDTWSALSSDPIPGEQRPDEQVDQEVKRQNCEVMNQSWLGHLDSIFDEFLFIKKRNALPRFTPGEQKEREPYARQDSECHGEDP